MSKVEELERRGLMRPAGRKAFEARTEDNTGVYSFERDRPAELPRDRFKPRGVGVLPVPAALVPQGRRALGDEREEGGDPRAAARDAGRGLGRGQDDQALDAAGPLGAR